MYIVVRKNCLNSAEHHTTFDCENCVNNEKCRNAGFAECELYKYLRPKFHICYLVPYLTTKQPRLIQIHLDINATFDDAFTQINTMKQKLTRRTR